MPAPFISTSILGELVFLGTGTSVGVPTIGCGCSTCRSSDSRDKRLRCSIILGLPEGNLLVDTTPDMRTQLLREGIGLVHSVLYTHEHADHLMGLDDLRIFPFYLGHSMPLYCEASVERRIRKSFDYAFTDHEPTHAGAAPQLTFHTIAERPFSILGTEFTPLRLPHGPRFEVLGFRFGKIAYCTDVSAIPPAAKEKLHGLDVLILGALRFRPHATHMSIGDAIEVARELRPRRTLFTHLSHEVEHEAASASLPSGMELAYDGLRLPLV